MICVDNRSINVNNKGVNGDNQLINDFLLGGVFAEVFSLKSLYIGCKWILLYMVYLFVRGKQKNTLEGKIEGENGGLSLTPTSSLVHNKKQGCFALLDLMVYCGIIEAQEGATERLFPTDKEVIENNRNTW